MRNGHSDAVSVFMFKIDVYIVSLFEVITSIRVNDLFITICVNKHGIVVYNHYNLYFSTPERRPSDIKDSEVYKMIQEADAKGKNCHVSDLENEAEMSREEEPINAPTGTRGHGLSFRVLQWMTDTADDDINDENETESMSITHAQIFPPSFRAPVRHPV